MILYYYMGPEYLRQNLQKRRLKISRYGRHGTLNDPFELTPYDVSNREFRKTHKRLVDDFAQKMGLICLSATRSSPAMWAHYTKNHAGACLEFKVTYEHIFQVTYTSEKLFPGIALDSYAEHIHEKSIKKILGTKSNNWAYEEEYRMHVPLKDSSVINDGCHHFLPFQDEPNNTFMLQRVFVGFRCGLGISNIQADLIDYPHKVEVIQTRPAFRSFEVVEQVSKSFWNMRELGLGESERDLPAVKAVFGEGEA